MTRPPLAMDLVAAALDAGVRRAAAELGWGEAAAMPVEVERPANPDHGDYATNVALKLARPLRRPPREIAEAIRGRVETDGAVAEVDVAGVGFVNVRLGAPWLARQVDAILEVGVEYGRSESLAGHRMQVEYVSANPTGPLTIANARGGPLGDVLANVLAFAGADVTREYYVDELGNQVEMLGRSVALRYRELGGEEVTIAEDAYPGEYVVEIARRIRDADGGRYDGASLEEQARAFTPAAVSWILEDQKRTVAKLRITFDEWFRDRSLLESGYFAETVEELRRTGHIEDRDGAVWLRSRALGEDIDSVVIRSNGEPTYFGMDIAYHRKCLVDRGFETKIDIWGANTHGHMRRMRTAMAALGLDDGRWEVVLYQYVRLVREGVLMKMGKRLGQVVWLEDVLDAVGADAARFFLLQRGADSTLDFDLELAIAQSNENPVYYVQYAHARIASIFRTAAGRGLDQSGADVALLVAPGELELVRACLRFPELVREVQAHRSVHLLTGYALELAGMFHGFYRDHRVVSDDVPLSKARLRLAAAVQLVLRQTLGLLGIDAPETM